jgi:hypothetical protein
MSLTGGGGRYIEFKPLQGAIASVPRERAGFWHREARWWALMSGFWHSSLSQTKVDRYVEHWHDAHAELVDGFRREHAYAGQYVGYVNHDRHASLRAELEAYYGGHVDQIQAIREKWDPERLFSHSRWCRRKEGCTIT